VIDSSVAWIIIRELSQLPESLDARAAVYLAIRSDGSSCGRAKSSSYSRE